MKTDFSSYGMVFQEGLVTLLVFDRAFCEQIREVLDINYFEYQYLKVIVQQVFAYKDKYKEHPTNDTIQALLNTELGKENELTQKQVKDFFQKVVKYEVDNKDYIKDKAIDFCKKQVLKSAMLKSVDLLDKSSFDEISTVINGALKLGLDNNVGHDFIEDFEERYQIKHRCPISTGWEEIDKIIGGGLGIGELGIVIAPSGIGKSFVLVHFGAQALKAGKNIIHYTLELSDDSVGNRYDSCLSGIPLNDLHMCKEQILELIKSIPGRLIIKEYPTKSVSTNGLRAHIEKCIQRGFKPDLIIVDYGDLLKAVTSYSEKRFELENNFEELRSIGQYFGCPVYSASQTNRLGLSQEVVTLSTISESFAKVFPADLIMCLSRSPEEKAGNLAKLHVAKNRMGPDSLVYSLFFDTSCAKIEVLKPGDAVTETTPEDKERELKKKYKNFLKNNKGGS
jgi:archaellum biogenesis ATPase FlaH